MDNARKKVDQLKIIRDNAIEEADVHDSDLKDKANKAIELEERMKVLNKEVFDLEFQIDAVQSKELSISIKLDEVEKKIREDGQALKLLEGSRGQNDEYRSKLSAELFALRKQNAELEKKTNEMCKETQACEEENQESLDRIVELEDKAKAQDIKMANLVNASRSLEINAKETTRRNSIAEIRISHVDTNLHGFQTRAIDQERKSVQLERKMTEKETELKNVKEKYIQLKNEFDNMIADIGVM